MLDKLLQNENHNNDISTLSAPVVIFSSVEEVQNKIVSLLIIIEPRVTHDHHLS